MTRNSVPNEPGQGQRSHTVLANVAMLYYKEGLTQSDIANRMGVSRATVVNYLRVAREQNIVDIRINGASFSSSTLSSELKSKFGLKDAYIALYKPSTNKRSKLNRQEQIRHVARIGAMALLEQVQADEKLGIAWGETIHLLVKDMPHSQVAGLSVCQMIGSMESPLLPHSTAEYCAIRVANCFGADCHTLHAPAILSTASIARSLRSEPIIKSQLQRLKSLDRSVFSVGNCHPNTHVVQSGIARPSDLEWYRNQGAVGVLCGRFIDEHGQPIVGELDERIIGIDLHDLKKCKENLLVVSGEEKQAAILGTLRGGYVSHIAVDDATARRLIDS